MNVQVTHITRQNPDSTKTPLGTLGVCIHKDQGVCFAIIAGSFVSRQDQFNYKIGRDIVTGRINKFITCGRNSLTDKIVVLPIEDAKEIPFKTLVRGDLGFQSDKLKGVDMEACDERWKTLLDIAERNALKEVEQNGTTTANSVTTHPTAVATTTTT